jgi:hypothetical protein
MLKTAMTLKDYIAGYSRQDAARRLGYAPTTLDKLVKRGAVVIAGDVYAPVAKRKSRIEQCNH